MLPLLLIAAALVPASVTSALQHALALPDARLEVRSFTAPLGCVPLRAEAPRPIAASGRVALHLFGDGCDAWAFASVRVFAKAFVLARPVREGEPLEGACERRERELPFGDAFITTLPPGARASRGMPAGTALHGEQVRLADALVPGAAVQVEVHSGALVVLQPGRATSCAAGAACAVLPSGKRVQGRLQAGRVVVEAL